MTTVWPPRSDASNEISSSTRSSTVCRRRAPMFSTVEFTSTAASAIASMASGLKSSVTPSVASSATYCLMRLAWGSVRMRLRSSRVRALSSTRIGRRPCSSGSRSDGFETWKRARGDEENVVRFHRAVLGRNGRAFDQRQEIALHAFARYIGAAADAFAARADLVDLVEEDDAVVLDRRDRFGWRSARCRSAYRFLRRSECRSCP